ncbi:hypothetical protein [Edaphocola flava]|uniref:hypothetical protein n=1 Tax=Edaphocola flava TaxID=2499629 RepID=UPI00100BB912|nr:hypothetical protein [Edaphocola flava]
MIEHLQKLDFVLDYFKKKKEFSATYNYSLIETYVKRTPEMNITTLILKEILEKLVSDGYLTKTEKPTGLSYYNISFKGLVFEGYVLVYTLSQKEIQRVNMLEQEQRALAYSQNQVAEKTKNLTVWVAIGTIIAAVYYLLEIWKFFFEKDS